MAEKRANLGPPKFQWQEEVRVLRVTGSETDDDGEPINAEELVGRTLGVNDARPTSSRDGWLINVYTLDPSEDFWDDVWFAEDSLERVGPKPTGQGRLPGWRENVVSLDLVTNVIYDDPGEDEEGDTEEERQVERIVERVLAVLRPLGRVHWTFTLMDGQPIEINITLWPNGDLFETYRQVVSLPACAWTHGEDRKGFPVSYWARPEGVEAHFLVPNITSATVTCEHWSSPERLIALSTPRLEARSAQPR